MAKVGPAVEASASAPPSATDGVKAERAVNPEVVCFAPEAGASLGVGGGLSGVGNHSSNSKNSTSGFDSF